MKNIFLLLFVLHTGHILSAQSSQNISLDSNSISLTLIDIDEPVLRYTKLLGYRIDQDSSSIRHLKGFKREIQKGSILTAKKSSYKGMTFIQIIIVAPDSVIESIILDPRGYVIINIDPEGLSYEKAYAFDGSERTIGSTLIQTLIHEFHL